MNFSVILFILFYFLIIIGGFIMAFSTVGNEKKALKLLNNYYIYALNILDFFGNFSGS